MSESKDPSAEDAAGALWAAGALNQMGRHTDASELVALAARFRAQAGEDRAVPEPVLHLVTVTFPGADGTPKVWEMCGPGPVSIKIDPMDMSGLRNDNARPREGSGGVGYSPRQHGRRS